MPVSKVQAKKASDWMLFSLQILPKIILGCMFMDFIDIALGPMLVFAKASVQNSYVC